MGKVRLSFSTLNTTINAPHTWINKQLGLKTFSIVDFEQGKAMHRIVQDHVSGVKSHDLLTKLPTFKLVEKVDFDEDMKIEYHIDDKYFLIGYVDGLDPERGDILEIKSGKQWTMGDFIKTPQWKIYALALPTYKNVWMANVPKVEALWMPQTVKLFRAKITDADKKDALKFIKKGIGVIENIKEEVEKEMALREEKGWKGRSRWCFYTGCDFCKG